MSNKPPAFVGSVPEKYERYLGPYVFEPYAKDLVGRIHPEGMKTVLEIACGTGRVTNHLRNALSPDTRLVATDLNADMIGIAKINVPDQGIEWVVADALELPFEDGYFDLVVCQFGLMFVPDKARALEEFYRVLKPGGHILLSTWDRLENNPAFFLADQIVSKYFPADPPLFFHIPFSLHDKGELVLLFERAGFEDCRISLVEKACSSDSAEYTAIGMLEGTPIYPTINQRDPELLPVIKKELGTELGKRFGEGPMISSMQAWMVEGTKKLVYSLQSKE
jgi:ubiquinone/menaquinone biosynthesis C-methylase UbiE